MPKFQILDPAPGFGSQLGAALGGGLGQGLSQGIGQSLSSYFKQKENTKALEGLRPIYEAAGLPPEEFDSFAKSGLDVPSAVNALKIVAGQRAKQQESALSDKEYSSILDEMEGLLSEGKAGRSAFLKSYLPGFGEEREATARFQSLGTSVLGLAQKVALKQGIRNQREFDEFIKRTVPNESDTVDTARGKINSLRRYLHGESGPKESISVEEGFVTMKDPQGKLRKVPKSKALEFQKAGGKLVQ